MAEKLKNADLVKLVSKLEASNKRYKAAAKAYREDERAYEEQLKKLKLKVKSLTAEIKEYEKEWADWDEEEASSVASFSERESRFKERIRALQAQVVKLKGQLSLGVVSSEHAARDEEDVQRIVKLKASVIRYQEEAASLREENEGLRADLEAATKIHTQG